MKSVTAKLLATENITVVQENVRTASFDVKNRVLTLPLWADVEEYVEDHLTGHEVGHALYTPLEGWHDAVCNRGPNFKSFLNVVEDARIEKLVQRKYPGLRSIFIKSYRKLLADGFFGADIDAINDMGLIDRINTYFKCGMSAGVKFSEVEQQWIPRIEALETWEEVEPLTEELFQFCKQQMEEQKQQEQNAAEDEEEESEDSSDDGSGFGSDFDSEDGEEDMFDFSDDGDEDSEESDSSAANTDGDGEDSSEDSSLQGDSQGEESEGQESESREGGANHEDGPRSLTDETLRDSIDSMTNTDVNRVANYTIKAPKYSDHIVSYKTVLREFEGIEPVQLCTYFTMEEWKGKVVPEFYQHQIAGAYLYAEWQRVNKKAVNHMVKEFEMKKQASLLARASTSKTGVLDTIKMNNYKLTDDIFKKVTVLPEGKNHAFVMFLDMSGSMHEYMYETAEQTLLLASFCRQINVPFRVYGFTDQYERISQRGYGNTETQPVQNQFQVGDDIRLIELFSNEMNKKEFSLIAGTMLSFYLSGTNNWDKIRKVGEHTGVNYRSLSYSRNNICLSLGGTPLDAAISLAIPLINDFRAKTRVDIMNVMFLTDGASHEMECNGDNYNFRSMNYFSNHVTITSPYSNKTFKSRLVGQRMTSMTELMLEMLKEETGANTLGYFIVPQTKGQTLSTYYHCTGRRPAWNTKDEIWKKMRTEGFLSINAPGYDEFFLIGDKSLRIEDNKMDDVVAGELSKAKLRTVFGKAQSGSKKSRKMLNDIVSRVA